MLVPGNPDAKEPFFDNSARAMIKCYLLHLMTDRPVEEQNLWTLYQWLRLSGDERIDLWAEMRTNDALDGLVRLGVGEFTHFGSDSNTLASVVSTAQDATRFLESKHLRATLCQSGFQPYDLTQGGMTVYVILPERYFTTQARFLRLVVGLSLRACNHRPKERINFILDESGVIGKIDDIQAGYVYAAGQNIRIWSFFQNLNQVKKLYGEEDLSAFTGCQHSMYFGIDCQFTAEYVEKTLGATTIVVSNHSQSNGKEGSTKTNSYSKTGRPLMTADEVSKSEEIINFYRQDKTRFKYKIPLWRFFEASPNSKANGFSSTNDSFEQQRAQFMKLVDVMPQHRPDQQASPEATATPLSDTVAV
jgi:type IV secretion system protein VirD4